ncbi:PIF1-like helicase-domain-containing protein [Melampsora americana]|nr:PIF1-like helicase-domain-containing protein [Melampsora americana]
MALPKFYAVRVGRNGPNVYKTWKETEEQVRGYQNARHKSFPTERQAREWLEGGVKEENQKSKSNPTLQRAWFGTDVKVEEEVQKTHHQSLHRRKRYFDSKGDDGVEEQEVKKLKIIDHPFFEDTNGDYKRAAAYVTELAHSYRDLSDDQRKVFKSVQAGESLFFTGSAGTGKSFLLKTIIDYLKSIDKKVAVTASTGIAASHLSGTTLHSFAGIGLGKEDQSKLIWKVRKSKHSKERWESTDVLIIDESE